MPKIPISILLLFATSGLSQAAAPQPVAPFSVDDLVRLIEDNHAETIESVVPLLPEDLRGNFTFLEMSDSLQAGDPLSPRAVLWSERGRMALAFNGGAPGQRGGNTLEILQADPETDRIHFLELAFPLARGGDGKLLVKPSEPQSCLQCHGAVSRPVWQEYPSWTRSFGRKDDFPDGQQGSDYDAFVERARSHPRFRNLLPAESDPRWNPFFPYRPDLIIRPNSPTSGFVYRPNLRLGEFLQRLNARRVFRMIQANPSYVAKREALLSRLMNCGGSPADASAPAILKTFGLTLADFDIRNTYDDPANAVLDFRQSYFDGSATALEYLVALLLQDWAKGEPTRADSFRLRGLLDKYQADTYRNLTDRPLLAVIDALGLWFPLPYAENDLTRTIQLREVFKAVYQDQYARVCSSLQGLVSADPSGNGPLPDPQSVAQGQRVLQARCVHCHGAENPALALDTPAALRRALGPSPQSFLDRVAARTSADASPDSRMPLLGNPLSDEERKSLLDYLKQLASAQK